MQYPKATVTKRSGKKSFYACCTIPEALRPFFKGRKQAYKSLETDDKRDAYVRLNSKEAEIWREFDQADLANHPLVQAAKKLEEAIRHKSYVDFEEFEWRPEDWFSNELRWHLEDDLRTRLSEISGNIQSLAPEDYVAHAALASRIEHIYDTFLVEFRKLSEERFSPKTRGKLFSAVAEEYFGSVVFTRNKKDNQPKRIKTMKSERSKIETFMKWSGSIALTDFTRGLGTRFAEALVNPSSGLVNNNGKEVAAETVMGYFTAVRNVLTYAINHDYMDSNPWHLLDLRGIGRQPIERRSWTRLELQTFFKLDLPAQERLLAAILACTGCRLDEAATLEWGQIHAYEQDGQTYTYLDVTNAVVKNRASKRLIPVIPALKKMLDEFPCGLNKKEPQRLFSYAKDADGKAENKASRALMTYVRKVSKDQNFNNHSLRHTFNSLCRLANLDSEMREFIVGRSGSGEGAKYGDPADTATYVKALSGIDWSFLYKHES